MERDRGCEGASGRVIDERLFCRGTRLLNTNLLHRKLILFIVLAWNLITLSAQDNLVYPNRPMAMLKKNQGLISMLEYQGGLGTGNEDLPYSKSFNGFTALIGYHVNRSFTIAAGTGVSVYNGGSLIPLFGDLRYTFYISRLAPFLFADAGLLMNFSNFDRTKIFMNGGIGARYSISRKFALNISAGLLLQAGEANQQAFTGLKSGVTYKF